MGYKTFDSLSKLAKSLAANIKDVSTAPLLKGTQKILSLLYQKVQGPMADKLKTSSGGSLPRPLIISFHPKLSLLNNNVHEAFLATLLAKELNMVPLWIPYVYDTATHSSAEGGKIRAPTYAFIEDKFIPMRTATQIHGNIIKTEKKPQKKEINSFFNELETHLIYMLGSLHNHLNQYNFGHNLFDLKRAVMTFNRKKLKKEIQKLKEIISSEAQRGHNLGESLGNISQALMIELGIPINVAYIEQVLPILVRDVFPSICSTKQVKDDPSLLEGLFIHYDFKTKERTGVQFTGDSFIAIDDNARRHFDGSIEDLADGIERGDILPTGPALILIFSALGCSITLGGEHTQEYYPDYISNANRLLEGTEFNHDMKVIAYSGIRLFDLRNFIDILSVSRVLEKVGSRTIVKEGKIMIPDHIVEHLEFLTGKEEIPSEYSEICKKYLSNGASPNRKSALEKEQSRYNKIARWGKMNAENLRKEISELQPYFRKLNLNEISNERLLMIVENLVSDSDMRLKRLKDNIKFEQHILGGRISRASDEELEEAKLFGEENELIKFEEIFGGILIRSKRIPTLIELYLYGANKNLSLKNPLILDSLDTPFYLSFIRPSIYPISIPPETKSFDNFMDIFNSLIPKENLPKWFRS